MAAEKLPYYAQLPVFIEPEAGQISVDGRLLSGNQTWIAPEHRQLGLVYQDYALFPHLTVAQNIEFGLFRQAPDVRHQRCQELLELMQMQGLEQRFPAELSGGQQQRIALARSMAPKPALLLLDEPFSGLDTELRRELSLDIGEILKQQNSTALLVTHDQEEAFAMADRVGVMNQGELLQWGSAESIYQNPRHRFVAEFVGRGCMIAGCVRDSSSIDTELGCLVAEYTSVTQGEHPIQPGQQVELLIRPDELAMDATSNVRAKILRRLFVGANTLCRVRLHSGTELDIQLPNHNLPALGVEIGLKYTGQELIAFELHKGNC